MARHSWVRITVSVVAVTDFRCSSKEFLKRYYSLKYVCLSIFMQYRTKQLDTKISFMVKFSTFADLCDLFCTHFLYKNTLQLLLSKARSFLRKNCKIAKYAVLVPKLSLFCFNFMKEKNMTLSSMAFNDHFPSTKKK